jgi:hypothetical protein
MNPIPFLFPLFGWFGNQARPDFFHDRYSSQDYYDRRYDQYDRTNDYGRYGYNGYASGYALLSAAIKSE